MKLQYTFTCHAIDSANGKSAELDAEQLEDLDALFEDYISRFIPSGLETADGGQVIVFGVELTNDTQETQ